MDNKLQSALNNISELDFIQLRYRLDTATWVRSVMKKYNLLDKELAEKLGITLKKFKHFKTGAYIYTLEDWARLQAIETELGIEVVKAEVEKRIQFPDYKYSEAIKS